MAKFYNVTSDYLLGLIETRQLSPLSTDSLRLMVDADPSIVNRMVATVDEVAGVFIFTERDELSEPYGFTPFVGFVFVDEQYRGKRLSGMMIQK